MGLIPNLVGLKLQRNSNSLPKSKSGPNTLQLFYNTFSIVPTQVDTLNLILELEQRLQAHFWD